MCGAAKARAARAGDRGAGRRGMVQTVLKEAEEATSPIGGTSQAAGPGGGQIVRRAAAVGQHALAERPFGVLLLRGLLAGLPQGRLPAGLRACGPARLRRPPPALRGPEGVIACPPGLLHTVSYAAAWLRFDKGIPLTGRHPVINQADVVTK
ncbi:hypothetical protein P376_0438 [Streptomyces sp. HCCB10043]|nr:hypothetical protein P376_0438 [Streptomyces sp. HCCB10043]EWS94195.1 hypothetical protein SSIG_04824 [Streptomyces filamentosus NRRL 11379]